jgi:hypothetical protein
MGAVFEWAAIREIAMQNRTDLSSLPAQNTHHDEPAVKNQFLEMTHGVD